MAYEFKKLNEVEIGALCPDTNVLVVEVDNIKQIPADQILPSDVVKSVNGQTPDSDGNVYINAGTPEPNIYYCDLDEEGMSSHLTLYWDNNYADGEGGPVWEDEYYHITMGVDIIEYEWDGFVCQSIIMGACEERKIFWFLTEDGTTYTVKTPRRTEQ
jgi:hypothetical protein